MPMLRKRGRTKVWRSAPLESRRPLLAKRRHAFGEIAALAGLALQVALEIELRLEIVVHALAHGLLDQAERVARAGGKTPRKRHHLADEGLVFEHLVDNAHVVKLIGRDLVGGEHESQRKLRPND